MYCDPTRLLPEDPRFNLCRKIRPQIKLIPLNFSAETTSFEVVTWLNEQGFKSQHCRTNVNNVFKSSHKKGIALRLNTKTWMVAQAGTKYILDIPWPWWNQTWTHYRRQSSLENRLDVRILSWWRHWIGLCFHAPDVTLISFHTITMVFAEPSTVCGHVKHWL